MSAAAGKPWEGPDTAVFGDVLINVRSLEIVRNGDRISLKRQPALVLATLVKRAGEIVAYTELSAVIWPEHKGGSRERNLYQAVHELRSQMEWSEGWPIKTVPTIGYLFVADVSWSVERGPTQESSPLGGEEAKVEKDIKSSTPQQDNQIPDEGVSQISLQKANHLDRRTALTIAGGGILSAGLLVRMAFKPSVAPHSFNAIPITGTGLPKLAPIVSDGTHIYFTEQVSTQEYRVVKFHQEGGEPSVLHTIVEKPYVCQISPDKTRLLLRNVEGPFDGFGPLFQQPLDGSTARPLNEEAFDGTWTPDGRTIAAARGNKITLIDPLNGDKRTLVEVEENSYCWFPRYSPDGKRLRFTVTDTEQANSTWEVLADGSRLRRVFPKGSVYENGCRGNWTSKGTYFVFDSSNKGALNIWAAREEGGLFGDRVVPFQITSGPTSFRGPLPSTDGKKIFARGILPRGELLEFDLHSGKQSICMPGIFSDMSAESTDGSRTAYHTVGPEHSMWLRKKGESGNGLRFLSYPFESAFPAWSPQGDRLVCVTRERGHRWILTLIYFPEIRMARIEVYPRNVLHPSWFPDGNALLFGTIPALEKDPAAVMLYRHELTSGLTVSLPGTIGKYVPKLSPDGTKLAALQASTGEACISKDNGKTWHVFSGIQTEYVCWSTNSNVAYCLSYLNKKPVVVQLDPNGKTSVVIELPNLQFLVRWASTTKQGTFLIARNASVQEVYCLELDLPLTV
jgi:Tol biopolymer transport system component/DNA-binding winged helix-turn-helix (wHTH) protein